MCAKYKKNRISEINEMLLELASGNPFYRLKRTGKDNSIEGLVVIINMLAEEMQQLLIHQGYINSKGKIKHMVQMNFILDHHGIIQMINQKTAAILATLNAPIINKRFENLLTDESKARWQKTWKIIQQKDFTDTSLELTFKAQQKLLVPSYCHVTDFSDKETVLVTVIHYYNTQDKLESDVKESIVQFISKQEVRLKKAIYKPKKHTIRLSEKDIEKIRKGHDMIVNHLEKELPSLKDFALQLGTNEFKLKYGFKELYGISVFRFLVRERLRKSKTLIQYTNLSLKSIAHMVGFKSSPHFSKAFKKQYGYAPSLLRKNHLKEE
ncbi:AraC family transcriptional regulator [uncultured Polaribacter sp.]|uniref:AraC family transcriptional regulator n=1 Tax=uncultured Polaribacter sp. TaxID=174711 RepID=UPI002620CFB3|nr:AraC family transcriptional regulator [uncultured Polaribacter sp.]